MADPRTPPAMRLPTLTEVVHPGTIPVRASARPDGPGIRALPTADERLVDEVLASVHQRVNLALERRVREALAPALARLVDQAVHEAREELARTLRDLVGEAVGQELARRRMR